MSEKIRQTKRGIEVLSSNGSTWYEVRTFTRLDECGSMYFEQKCSCPAGQHGRHCKHIDAANDYINSGDDCDAQCAERVAL